MIPVISSIAVLGLAAVVLAGCGGGSPTPADTELPNPASVNCLEQGGRLDIREDAEGNQFGICVFEDGSECDEWEYYRGECAPGEG